MRTTTSEYVGAFVAATLIVGVLMLSGIAFSVGVALGVLP